jgi:hypothetical protein
MLILKINITLQSFFIIRVYVTDFLLLSSIICTLLQRGMKVWSIIDNEFLNEEALHSQINYLIHLVSYWISQNFLVFIVIYGIESIVFLEKFANIRWLKKSRMQVIINQVLNTITAKPLLLNTPPPPLWTNYYTLKKRSFAEPFEKVL